MNSSVPSAFYSVFRLVFLFLQITLYEESGRVGEMGVIRNSGACLDINSLLRDSIVLILDSGNPYVSSPNGLLEKSLWEWGVKKRDEEDGRARGWLCVRGTRETKVKEESRLKVAGLWPRSSLKEESLP